jgi:hypothetical protein
MALRVVAGMFWLGHGLSDFGAAIGALIDEIDLRHTPMRLNISNVHREQAYAAWADYRDCLNFVVMDVGWHVGSPAEALTVSPQPENQHTAHGRCSS